MIRSNYSDMENVLPKSRFQAATGAQLSRYFLPPCSSNREKQSVLHKSNRCHCFSRGACDLFGIAEQFYPAVPFEGSPHLIRDDSRCCDVTQAHTRPFNINLLHPRRGESSHVMPDRGPGGTPNNISISHISCLHRSHLSSKTTSRLSRSPGRGGGGWGDINQM